MVAAMIKSERLPQVEQLLLTCLYGLHRAEIARRLSGHSSTVTRDFGRVMGVSTLMRRKR